MSTEAIGRLLKDSRRHAGIGSDFNLSRYAESAQYS